MWKTVALVFLVLTFVLGGVIVVQSGVVKVSLNWPSKNNSLAQKQVENPKSDENQKVSEESSKKEELPKIFSGTVKKSDKDLGIFNKDFPEFEYIKDTVSYFEAGTYTSGKFVGYKRYLALFQYGPGEFPAVVMVSNDDQKFILDSANFSSGYYNNDPKNSLFNKSKVVGFEDLPDEIAQEIPLTEKFSLVKKEIYSESDYTKQTPVFTVIPSKTLVPLDSDLTTHEVKVIDHVLKVQDKVKAEEKEMITVENSFVSTDTAVFLKDSTGLYYRYELTNKENLKKFQAKQAEYLVNRKKYIEWEKNGAKGVAPQSWLDKSDLSVLLLKDINPPGANTYYQSYGIPFPQMCSFFFSTRVLKNVSDKDLVPAFDSANGQLYTFKDKNHPLLKLEYYRKVSEFGKEFWDVNTNKQKYPSFEEYVSKNPILVFVDPFKRFVGLGEYDVILPGGCGKPVVYLYPTKDTKVSLQFTTSMDLTTQIPPYKNGWQVLAKPNGTLADLNHKQSDCSQIDPTRFGSEYALSACQKNEYPYIYWSGNSHAQSYPVMDKGWVVARNDLRSFLQKKLNLLGLTDRESVDMISYWQPKMEGKGYPYYRISFLVDQQVSNLFPMKISPVPDSMRRIFLDWQGLIGIPAESIEPQVLPAFDRHGFALVEWGGLYR